LYFFDICFRGIVGMDMDIDLVATNVIESAPSNIDLRIL
jgi:hypothetical protein